MVPMYIVREINQETYQKIATRLHELHPDYKMQMVNCDINLERLGFCESAPCELHLDINEDQYLALLDELIGFEVDAYNTDSGDPDTHSTEYELYERYTWIYDYLFHALDADDQQ